MSEIRRSQQEAIDDVSQQAVEAFGETMDLISRAAATSGRIVKTLNHSEQEQIQAAMERMLRKVAKEAFAAGRLHATVSRLNGGHDE